MSAPQTARQEFDAWWRNSPHWRAESYYLAWNVWQAAERSAIERAAKVADELSDCSPSYIAEAIRSLIT